MLALPNRSIDFGEIYALRSYGCAVLPRFLDVLEKREIELAMALYLYRPCIETISANAHLSTFWESRNESAPKFSIGGRLDLNCRDVFQKGDARGRKGHELTYSNCSRSWDGKRSALGECVHSVPPLSLLGASGLPNNYICANKSLYLLSRTSDFFWCKSRVVSTEPITKNLI